ncbi:hypothetical protein E2C01_013056 [Portunus trituberculatus]|uniref:Uncharacterized protein n=1 Tax=Portunus trituberculatus TaxID=210409 RepID=A0A5B7DFZ5_PORTR|nr:hypothetical protein [Portunus trituberculatus]
MPGCGAVRLRGSLPVQPLTNTCILKLFAVSPLFSKATEMISQVLKSISPLNQPCRSQRSGEGNALGLCVMDVVQFNITTPHHHTATLPHCLNTY